MSLLKTYEIAAVNLTKLGPQISPFITNYTGASFESGILSIFGDALVDETSLDAAVASHDPTEIPSTLTPRQLRLCLFNRGIAEEDVVAAINTLESPTKEQANIGWEYALEFQREDTNLNTIANILGLTEADIDQIFLEGQTI